MCSKSVFIPFLLFAVGEESLGFPLDLMGVWPVVEGSSLSADSISDKQKMQNWSVMYIYQWSFEWASVRK